MLRGEGEANITNLVGEHLQTKEKTKIGGGGGYEGVVERKIEE